MFDHLTILTILVSYVALLLSLCVHEACHAWSALHLGDDTAQRLGRLTLNPLAHVDPIGTVLFPLLGYMTGFPFIGWAKPVPVQPLRFNRNWTIRGGMAVVAAAGPVSNLMLAALFFAMVTLGLRFAYDDPMARWDLFWAAIQGPRHLAELSLSSQSQLVLALGGRLVLVNIFLAIFNLIPAGPLDGASVIKGFLSPQGTAKFERFQPYLYIGLLLMVFFPGLGKYFFGPIITVVGWCLQLGARLVLGV